MAGIQPEVYFEPAPHPIGVPDRPGRGVFVVRIPLSALRPHMVWEGRSKGKFYKRAMGGHAVEMDVYEVRDQMLFREERYRKLTLLRLELAGFRDQVQRILANRPRPHETLIRFDTSAFKGLVADVIALLPQDIDYLKLLLRVPSEADGTSRLLEEAREHVVRGDMERHPELVGSCANEVSTHLRWFDDLVAEVERLLEQRFGPLGSTGSD